MSAPRLKTHYNDVIVPKLKEELGISNPMAIPKLDKIVINMGVSGAVTDRKVLQQAMEEMALIAGQKPVETVARKSEAGFKIRDGMKIGCKVTLRGTRMYEFFDRLTTMAMPRIRDFRGVSAKGFDGRGNYSFGIQEQIVFPEIEYDKIDTIRGMNICIVTTAKNNEEGKALLSAFEMPFQN